MLDQAMIIILEIAFSIAAGLFFFQRKSISKSGFIALLLICTLFISLQEITFLIVLFSMFASSSLLSKFKAAKKQDMEKTLGKSSSRTSTQAMANLGAAVFCFICYYITKNMGFVYAFLGSVATSNADTWASEIGGISKKKPVLITNFEKVEKGISGGVTVLGTIGGILGAFFISSIGAFVIHEQNTPAISLFTISFITGIAGFLVDSYVGALFQAKYRSTDYGKWTEVKNNQLVKGLPWLNNDGVNAIATLFGALLGFLIYTFV